MTVLYCALEDLSPLEPGATAPGRLPTLEGLLARATVVAAVPDWRGWAQSAFGIEPASPVTVGRTVAAAAGLAGGGGSWCVATPVRLVAGPNHVRLDAAAPDALTAAGAARL